MDTKELIQILVSLVGIGGFLFGVLQYGQAQRWKRLEYAAGQLQRLQLDPDLALATAFLDSSERAVPLPAKYQVYKGEPVFNHNCQVMYRKMALEYENTPEFFIYADAFERLFEYLVQIYAFIDMKLIKAGDVKSLKWILEDLARPQWSRDNRVFVGRISSGFDDIFQLMDIYGIEHVKKMTEKQITAMHEEYEAASEQRTAE